MRGVDNTGSRPTATAMPRATDALDCAIPKALHDTSNSVGMSPFRRTGLRSLAWERRGGESVGRDAPPFPGLFSPVCLPA